MISPINIPRGVANLFVLGLGSIDTFDEETQFRPDKIHHKNSSSRIKDEMIDNYISMISPISAVKGSAEIFTNSLFKSYFEG